MRPARTNTTRYDVVEHLRVREEEVACLGVGLEEADGGAAFRAKALGDIARGKGTTRVVGVSSLSRESLCKALLGERSGDFVILLISVRAHSRRTSCPPPRTDGRHHSGRVECSCDLPFSATGETRLEKRVDGGKLETDCGPAWPRSDRRLDHRID